MEKQIFYNGYYRHSKKLAFIYYFSSNNYNTSISQKFYNILGCTNLWCMFHMTKAAQAVEGTCCGWLYCGSGYTDIVCIASFHVCFESHTDECAT